MAVRKILKVKVDQSCIDKGVPKMNDRCPIWWALLPKLQTGCFVKVFDNVLKLYAPVGIN